MNSDVAGSILTVFAVKRKKDYLMFKNLSSPKLETTIKTTMRAIRSLHSQSIAEKVGGCEEVD